MSSYDQGHAISAVPFPYPLNTEQAQTPERTRQKISSSGQVFLIFSVGAALALVALGFLALW